MICNQHYIKQVHKNINIVKCTSFVFKLQSDVEAKEREVTKMQLETWCAKNHVASCIETSAKNASNVQEAFHMAVEHWMKAERCADRQAENAELNDTVDLRKVNLDTRSSCCARNSE